MALHHEGREGWCGAKGRFARQHGPCWGGGDHREGCFRHMLPTVEEGSRRSAERGEMGTYPGRGPSIVREDGPGRDANVELVRLEMRPAGFEPATKGFEGPRVSPGLGLSHPPDAWKRREAGRSWRGLLLGLTPLVSEPSRRPNAPPGSAADCHAAGGGLGFPQFTRFAFGGHPPAPPFPLFRPRTDESPALPLS